MYILPYSRIRFGLGSLSPENQGGCQEIRSVEAKEEESGGKFCRVGYYFTIF